MKDGWGLTVADDGYLIGTDSSTMLYTMELDQESGDFVTKRTAEIHDGNRPVKWLNEVEWIEGEVWGNIWQTECIARVSPADGAARPPAPSRPFSC
jgi:glutamine cyclotransferase